LVIAPFVDSNVRLNLSTKNKIHNPDDGEFTHKVSFHLFFKIKEKIASNF